MWVRITLSLAFCLVSSSVLVAASNAGDYLEVVPTPMPMPAADATYASPLTSDCEPDEGCVDGRGAPTGVPWWYWWHAYRGREQHYAPLPPLPGNYYFRPYSVSQLRAQQEATVQWGGDPRNPYAAGILPQPMPRERSTTPPAKSIASVQGQGYAAPVRPCYRPRVAPAAPSADTAFATRSKFSPANTIPGAPQGTPASPPPAERTTVPASFESVASTGASPSVAAEASPKVATEASPRAATDIIQWPQFLRDPAFADQRARVEVPFRRYFTGGDDLTVADYENMIDAAVQMKDILAQIAGEISTQEYLNNEKFLNHLAVEARKRIPKNDNLSTLESASTPTNPVQPDGPIAAK